MNRILVLVSFVAVFIGCTKDEDQFPSEFDISVVEVGINYAIISWTESVDPNGGLITYDLYFEDELLTSRTNEFEYRFDLLQEGTEYNVLIIATNDGGKRTEARLSFTTTTNQPPSEFEILEARNSSDQPMNIILKWGESVDPEGLPVIYRVYISDQLINTINAREIKLQHRPEKTVSGYIEAYDPANKRTRSYFSFENSFPTLDKDVTLTDQTEIDNFGDSGYKILLGRLDIHESNSGSITDLSPLGDLIHVTKGLRIYGNSNLVKLSGLESLTNDFFDPADKLYTNVYIANNPNLESIEGLLNLSHITKLQILNNGLRNLKGLGNISSFDDIEIIGNAMLKNIDDLLVREESCVQGLITIENNKMLQHIKGLNSVKILPKELVRGSGFVVRNNENLESIHAFSSATSFEGIIEIENNDRLVSIEGFTNIKTDQRSISISIKNNSKLTSIMGISGNNFISYLSLSNNDALEHINDAFSGLTRGNLVIEENEKLESINGLKDLYTAYSFIFIVNNPNLTTLQGLQGLINMEFDDQFDSGLQEFTIAGNNSLESLNGLENCIKYSSLAIVNNELLEDFCAIKPTAKFGMCCGDDGYTGIEGNAYNPTYEDLRSGNCSSGQSKLEFNF